MKKILISSLVSLGDLKCKVIIAIDFMAIDVNNYFTGLTLNFLNLVEA